MLNTKQIRAMRQNGEFDTVRTYKFNYKPLIIGIMVVMSVIAFVSCVHAEQTYAGYTLNQWADAIKKAEGNNNYGILSIPCVKGDDCRRICKNTVRNNWKRYLNKDKTPSFEEYLSFLANRYCPIGASNDPKGLNIHWKKNVKHFLKGNSKA